MHAVVRTYSGKGAKELFDILEQRKADVAHTMSSVEGFINYTMARCGDGGFTVTICQDMAGIDDSVRKAREWVARNAAGTGVGQPLVTDGHVIFSLDGRLLKKLV